jgi:hypothetical protein
MGSASLTAGGTLRGALNMLVGDVTADSLTCPLLQKDALNADAVRRYAAAVAWRLS